MAEGEDRPVLTGLVALIAVGLVVGLVAGFAALAATRILGLGGGASSSADSTSELSLYLPTPRPTRSNDVPLITLAPSETPPQETAGDSSPSQTPKQTRTRKPKKEISLSASQVSVSPMEQIDLTGIYPRGEGAILQVQRLEDGSWEEFPVTVSVSDETFSTYVQTSQPGVNVFRVVDTDTGLKSNEVRVRVT